MKRRLLEIPVVAMLIMTLTVPVFAASKTLGVSEIDQNKTYWCWASCSEMIGKYYNSGSNRDQYAIVKKIKGNTDNQKGTITNICDAIKYASVDSVTFTSKSTHFLLILVKLKLMMAIHLLSGYKARMVQ